METPRKLLIAAMLLVGYLLFWNWQHDYGANATPVSAATVTPVPINSASTDLPQLHVAADSSTALPVAVTAPVSIYDSGIHVSTDLMQITISRKGGDLTDLGLTQYPIQTGSALPFQLLSDGSKTTFVAESGLIGPDGPDAAAAGRPLYQTAQNSYALSTEKNELDVVLSTDYEGVHIDKTYQFKRGSYLIGLVYKVSNSSTKAWSGALFGQLKRDESGDPSAHAGMKLSSFLGAAWWTNDKPYNKLPLKNFGKSPLQLSEVGGWIALVQHYFVTAWVPDHHTQVTYSTRRQGNFNYVSIVEPEVTISPGQAQQFQMQLYAGPKIEHNLAAVSPGLDLTVDYGWLWPIAEFLFWLLNAIHAVVSNWGWSIILLTLLVKAAFWPLSAASYRSMAQMRKLAPEMARMKEQYGDDRQKLSTAMMEFYRKEKINPLGGCLPMLVQMPVFIALYWTLMESVQLRQAGFIFWIHDLSDMDHYFILPLLMGISMFVQQSLNPPPPDPMQAKMMKLMPAIFTVFFLFFPSGLVLYWLVSNLISIAQQWIITKRIEAAAR
ncbi:MAG: membrane protein insertase YidC [Pseudomonadales bacterium]|nr:membrane protein insertase YidC [Pseudomonadales bacterium]